MSKINMQQGSVFENGYGIVGKKVMLDKDISTTAKALYAMLCTYADASSGKKAFPSIKYMADVLDIHKDTLYKHLNQLIDKDYIRKHKHKENGKFARNEYEIIVLPCPNSSDTVSSDTENSYTENAEAITTNSITTSSKSTSSNKKPNSDDDAFNKQANEVVFDIWEYYKLAVEDHFQPRKLTSKRRGKIRDMLADFSVDEIKQAIDNITANNFMTGQADNNFKATIMYLFQFENMEKWIANCKVDNQMEDIDYYADLK